MFSSEAAISREMSCSNTSTFMFSDNSSYKNVMGNEILKRKDIAGSHLFQQQNHQSGGLMRFRSAPSSFLAGLIDRGGNSSSVNGGAGNFTENDGCFFSGFDVMREYRHSNGTNGEASSSTSGFNNNHINYSSAQQSAGSNNYMPTIAENESWNESSLSCLKRTQEGDFKVFPTTFNGMGSQNGESRNCAPGLTHHLSLPKTSAEMVAIEKYLHFQQDNNILCKIRAKRGCATHPRSIAERNRRTRISERMKKLHELFPNMDKTNTADMLDLAVEHIKDLQKQVQTLTDKRAKCTCSSKAQPYSHDRS